MTGARRPKTEDIPELMDEVSAGKSLNAACTERGIHAGHTYAFIRGDDRLWSNYARARAIRGDEQGHRVGTIIDQMIAGEVPPDVGRAAIDGLKWTAGRMAPKLWGDKQQHEHTGADGGPIQSVDLTNATDEDLDRLEQVITRIATRGPAPDAGSEAE